MTGPLTLAGLRPGSPAQHTPAGQAATRRAVGALRLARRESRM